jgi:hypothetical protein
MGSFENDDDSQKGKFNETAFAWSFSETKEKREFAMPIDFASVSLFAKPIVIAIPFAGVAAGAVCGPATADARMPALDDVGEMVTATPHAIVAASTAASGRRMATNSTAETSRCAPWDRIFRLVGAPSERSGH